ncbi:hemoglobin/transferrin/lactoferrin receptor protein [Sulfitobacter undariae]|uniref:Hemoglobin/transferrin/lactoferrin receptor protein n=1 Tax=Sulfitobacter undariae TaxID=1563671 RepID=A0A7W6E746_9RHOB|nr:TonB-dependent receptor [Sulfitobacter undariae]MBB3995965.1 hemoglobin/transferrin/lactoferrin receptor protein [Sulfitobacter undariae]
MTHTTAARIALSWLMCTTATFLYAQDDTAFDLGTLRIDSADAQAVLGNDQISDAEIESRNPTTVADVFAGESAITASGGAPIAQKVYVNGIEESLLSVTIDGARQNKSAFHHTGNVLLDPALLKSVEVSAGLAPADQGPNALAGSIAYTTKDARDLLEADDPFGGQYTLSYGRNGQGFRNTLSVFGQTNGFEYLLSGTRATGDDYKDGSGNTITGTEADLTDYIAKFAYTTQSGKRLSFSASETTDSGLRASQSGFIRPDFAAVIGRDTVLYRALSQRKSYTLTFQDENPTGTFAPYAQLSYNEQAMDVGALYGINKSLSGVIRNEFTLRNGSVSVGLDFFDESAEGFDNSGSSRISNGREDLSNIGVFAQARQDLSDRISVSFGARYDWASFDAADGSSLKENGASVNGSVDFVLNNQWTLNAGAASSWGGYELGEAALVNYGTAWAYDGFATSRANAVRLGLRYENGPWSAKGALFDTEIKDINAVLPSGGARGHTDDLTSRGFDGSVTYTAANGFATLNYTYADVKTNDATTATTAYYLGRPVGHIFGLEAGYDVTPEWRIGGTAQVALKNDDTETTLDGYEVVNLYAEYKPQRMENLTVRMDVNNLFDASYASRSSDGLGLSNVVPLYEPGRTISMTASIKF